MRELTENETVVWDVKTHANRAESHMPHAVVSIYRDCVCTMYLNRVFLFISFLFIYIHTMAP